MNAGLAGIFAEAAALWRGDRDLWIRIAAVFFFLPMLAVRLFVPEPDQTNVAPEAAAQAALDWIGANIGWIAGELLIQALGSCVVLVLLLDRARPALGQAIGRGLRLLPGYVLVNLAATLMVIAGLFALILPGLYAVGRTFVAGADYVAEPGRGPFGALVGGIRRTENRGWMLLLVVMALVGVNYLLLVLLGSVGRRARRLGHLQPAGARAVRAGDGVGRIGDGAGAGARPGRRLSPARGAQAGDLRRRLERQHARQPRIGEGLDRALVGDEAVAPVEAERGGMIERAGVHPDALHAGPPRPLQRLRHQPFAVPLARKLGHQAEEGQLALVRLAEIELEHAHFDAARIGGGEDRDVGIVDRADQPFIVHHQPREPQPRLADPAKQRAVSVGGRAVPLDQPEVRIGQGPQRRLPGHLQRGDDRRELVAGDGRQSHVACGGRLIRIASTLPPVLSPNSVPRS